MRFARFLLKLAACSYRVLEGHDLRNTYIYNTRETAKLPDMTEALLRPNYPEFERDCYI